MAGQEKALAGLEFLDDDSDGDGELDEDNGDEDDWVQDEHAHDADAEVLAEAKGSKKTDGKTYVPPSFFERDEFCTLESEGLAVLPETEGLGLSYHSVSHQWHARCGKPRNWISHRRTVRREARCGLCFWPSNSFGNGTSKVPKRTKTQFPIWIRLRRSSH